MPTTENQKRRAVFVVSPSALLAASARAPERSTWTPVTSPSGSSTTAEARCGARAPTAGPTAV